MVSSFLGCTRILGSRRRLPAWSLAAEASAFCSSLAGDLKSLVDSLAKNSVSLQWSIEAMSVLKKMHVDLLTLLKRFDLPVSYGLDQDWFDQYMEASMAFLDLCNSIKSSLSTINRYRIAIDLAIDAFSCSDDFSCMASLHKMKPVQKPEEEHSRSLGARFGGSCIKLKYRSSKRENKNVCMAMLAAKTTMLVVSSLLISAIISPIPVETGARELANKFPELKALSELLIALVDRCREMSSAAKILVEREMVDEVVGELKAQVVQGVVEDKERFQCGVELLRTRSAELREGVENFDALLDQVFDVVIKGRKEMLGVLKDEAL